MSKMVRSSQSKRGRYPKAINDVAVAESPSFPGMPLWRLGKTEAESEIMQAFLEARGAILDLTYEIEDIRDLRDAISMHLDQLGERLK